MKHKLLWAVFALPLEVWIPVEILRRGDPIVAGLLLCVIAFLAATAATKEMTPWGLVGNIIRYTRIGLLIGAGLVVSAIGLVFTLGKLWITTLPWPLIGLATGVYLIPLTLALATVQFFKGDMPIFWSVAGILYVALLVLVLWRSNK